MFDIYLYDRRVGVLRLRGRGVQFAYSEAALDDDRLPALSVSLPKRAEPYPDSHAGPFFRNLLPEQAYRRLVAAAAGTAPENSLALLGAIGGECPGAVSIWPTDAGPPAQPEYRPLTNEELEKLFSLADRQALGGAVARGRLSLAGAQEKIALLRQHPAQWLLPLKGAVTSHILKQATQTFPGIVENELFCMTLARRVGLPVPAAELATPEVRVFCVERFDRPPATKTGDPPRRKLHQEDFCQALRVEPERKYEADGGPGIRRCAEVIRRYSALPAEDLLRLARWVGFNYLIGNEDAHAKNLALLYLPDGVRLAPHYDLVSTEVYAELDRSLAMKIGSARDIRSVQRVAWQRFAQRLQTPWDRVRVTLLDLSELVSGELRAVLEECTGRFGAARVYEDIGTVVGRRREHLEHELTQRR